MGRLKSKMGESVEQKRKAKYARKKQILLLPIQGSQLQSNF